MRQAGWRRYFWFVAFAFFPSIGIQAETATVHDMLGRSVTLEVPVKRAVLFETYELLPALGAWERVVGLSHYAFDNDLIKAVEPELAGKVADVGAMSSMNAERLLALRPDVVVGWNLAPQAAAFLEARGIPVVLLNPQTMGDLEETLRTEGILFGRAAEAERAIAAMRELIAKAAGRTGDIPEDRRRKVLWMMGKPTAVGGRHSVGAQALEAVGLHNVAAEIDQPWAEVPVERILAWNPDLIFIWGWARFEPSDITASPQWRTMAAARTGEVWKTPRWSTWSPRVAPMALWMASKAYPDRFRDVDVRGEIDGFFHRVYGIPYSRVAPLDP